MLNSNWQYFFKLLLLAIFQACDLALNSTAEFTEFASTHAEDQQNEMDTKLRSNRTHLLLCTLQVLTQLSSFSVIFSICCETFPFQIGLIGILTNKLSSMLALQGVYFVSTIVVSCLRLSYLYDGKAMIGLWETHHYTVFSFLQKIIAPFYYAENLKVGCELGSSMYYTKTAWSNLEQGI